MKRLYYLDNLKLSLTVLVILHHIAIVFGGDGAFVISSRTLGSPVSNILLTGFLSINQSYFMGLFFAISAYFSYGSLKRKSKTTFIKNKCRRLLLPALFYFFILSPIIETLVHYYNTGMFKFILYNNIGALWFVLALFMFDVVYALLSTKLPIIKPKNIIIWLPVGIILTFLIRAVFPVGYFIPVVSFQPAHFTQYIIAYLLGISAAQIDYNKSFHEKWLLVVPIILALLGGVIYMITSSGLDLSYAFGGLNIYSLLYSLYDMLMFTIMGLGLIGLYKKYFNKSSPSFNRYTFGAYVMHALAIVIAVMIASLITDNHLLSLLLTTVVAVPLSFILSKLMKPILG